jgi:hypothetical protein
LRVVASLPMFEEQLDQHGRSRCEVKVHRHIYGQKIMGRLSAGFGTSFDCAECRVLLLKTWADSLVIVSWNTRAEPFGFTDTRSTGTTSFRRRPAPRPARRRPSAFLPTAHMILKDQRDVRARPDAAIATLSMSALPARGSTSRRGDVISVVRGDHQAGADGDGGRQSHRHVSEVSVELACALFYQLWRQTICIW